MNRLQYDALHEHECGLLKSMRPYLVTLSNKILAWRVCYFRIKISRASHWRDGGLGGVRDVILDVVVLV